MTTYNSTESVNMNKKVSNQGQGGVSMGCSACFMWWNPWFDPLTTSSLEYHPKQFYNSNTKHISS